MLITIRERAPKDDGFDAEIAFDNDPPYLVHVKSPFDADEEKRLQWYYERWLEAPHLREVRAKEAAQSVKAYGEALLAMLFADPDAYANYKQGLQAGTAAHRNQRFAAVPPRPLGAIVCQVLLIHVRMAYQYSSPAALHTVEVERLIEKRGRFLIKRADDNKGRRVCGA